MAKHPEEKQIELTEKQKMFCKEFIIDLNATQSAIRAGYSKDTARQIASDNLSKVHIQEEIQKLMDERSKKVGISAEWVLGNLKELAERCMQKVPVMRFNKETKMYEQETAMVQHEDGTKTEEGIWEFDSAGANRSLELLGKHLKLFTDKQEIENTGEQKLEINIKVIE